MSRLRLLALFGDGGQQTGRVAVCERHEIHFSTGALDDLMERGEGQPRVRREVLDEVMERIEAFDAVFSDSAEAVLLRFVRARRGLGPKPWLVNEVDRFGQADWVRSFVQQHYGLDPMGACLSAPEVLWFTITPGLDGIYRDRGLRIENLYLLPMARASIGFFFPETIALQDRLLAGEEDVSVDAPVAPGAVLALGSHERDYETFVQALELSGLSGDVICNLDQIAQRPSGPVRWHPSQPPPIYLECMRRAAVVVLPLGAPARAQGQLSCALPMRMGKAIVATAVDSLVDHVQPSVTGLSVRPGDATAMAEALARATSDGALRRRLGERAQAREAELSMRAERVLAEILDRLEDLVAARNRV